MNHSIEIRDVDERGFVSVRIVGIQLENIILVNEETVEVVSRYMDTSKLYGPVFSQLAREVAGLGLYYYTSADDDFRYAITFVREDNDQQVLVIDMGFDDVML